jgi:hypothetical protein
MSPWWSEFLCSSVTLPVSKINATDCAPPECLAWYIGWSVCVLCFGNYGGRSGGCCLMQASMDSDTSLMVQIMNQSQVYLPPHLAFQNRVLYLMLDYSHPCRNWASAHKPCTPFHMCNHECGGKMSPWNISITAHIRVMCKNPRAESPSVKIILSVSHGLPQIQWRILNFVMKFAPWSFDSAE